jgi:hypothetical protein
MRRLPLLSLLLLPAGALSAQQVERYTIDGDDVAIYNLAGRLQVEGGQGAVTVQVTRGGTDAAQLKVAQGEIDGRPSVRILFPSDRIHYQVGENEGSTDLRVRDDGTFGDDGDWGRRHERDRGHGGRRVTIGSASGGLDAHADLRVVVPAGQQVRFHLAVGPVTVTNVNGDLWIDASSSQVTATGVTGQLGVDVGSGRVQVSRMDGDLSVDTGSGSVEVSGVKGRELTVDTGSGGVTGTDLQGDQLSIDTGSGDIRLTALRYPRLDLETGSGGVTADLQDDVRELGVETGSGDIAITAPPSLGAEVEIETSSGDIETDFAMQITRHGRDHMTGTIGDGKGTISIETGSGEIKLLKRPS